MRTISISLAVALVVLPATALIGRALVAYDAHAITQLLKGTK
jgi:hypothetical protein